MVVNGGCKHKDMEHFQKYVSLWGRDMDVRFCYQANSSLLALQGDGAKSVMARLCPELDLKTMAFMASADATVAGIPGCRVTRCGYTGEDGFEISVNDLDAVALAEALLEQPEVQPAGLGARDSLRLEAGLCLYGNDIDEQTTPIEAGLTWCIGGPNSRRRLEQGFLGVEHSLEPSGKLREVTRKRVGIAGMKAPARGGVELYDAKGENRIGVVTSGGFAPSSNRAIAMGYVESAHALDGKEIMVNIRGKMNPAKITKMPFHPTNYFRVI
jgi:aminomethyltransferase